LAVSEAGNGRGALMFAIGQVVDAFIATLMGVAFSLSHSIVE
jgi:hypothetical protein